MSYWINCEVCGLYHSSLDEYGDLYDCWVELVNRKIKLKELITILKGLINRKN